MKFNFTLIFLIFLLPYLGNSQVIIGYEYGWTSRNPMSVYYGYSRDASIYTATEMNTVDNAGTITTLGWYSGKSSTLTAPTKIYLKLVGTHKQVAVANFNTLIQGATQVYSGTPSGWVTGWNDIDITDFQVPAGQNLMVLVECNNGGTGNGTWNGTAFKYTESTINSHATLEVNSGQNTTNLIRDNQRPNIRLGGLTIPPMPDCVTLTYPNNGATGVDINQKLYFEPATTGGSPSGYYGIISDGNSYFSQYIPAGQNWFIPNLYMDYNSTYYWSVIPYNNSGENYDCEEIEYSYTTKSMPNPPANDVCSTAINLTPNGQCNPVSGTLEQATGDGMDSDIVKCGSFYVTSYDDVWYKFTATTTSAEIRVESDFNAVIELRSSCSGAVLACENDFENNSGIHVLQYNNLSVNTVYYIKLFSREGSIFLVNYNICVKVSGSAPSNDNCVDAVSLTDANRRFLDPGVQSIYNANWSSNAFNCYPYVSGMKDTWYKLTTDNDGNPNEKVVLTFTPHNGVNLDVAVYTGSCTSLTQVTCNDEYAHGMPEVVTFQENGFTQTEISVRDNTTYYIRVVDRTGYGGQYTISGTGSALPLHILNFSAQLVNKEKVDLSWNVSDEKDVLNYTIEKSDDAFYFTPLADIKTTHRGSYNTIDEKPFQGVNYYRLKVIHQDGSVQYSKIQKVNFQEEKVFEIYPNPATAVVNVHISETVPSGSKLFIYDYTGNVVLEKQITSSNNQIDIASLPNGIYIMKYQNEQSIYTNKFIKF